jgi:hypothetical protein
MHNKNFFSIALVFAMLLTAGTGLAADVAGKEAWRYHDIVDTDFVKKHVTVPMAEDVMIIDARPKRAKYDKGHIPMAVNMPTSKFDKMVGILPENKDALLIFYCEGPT